MSWEGGRPSIVSLVRGLPSTTPRLVAQSSWRIVIDLARLIVAYAPQSLHTERGLGDRFMHALLEASDWDKHWTPPMTKTGERNILLLLRTVANALQENAKFEDITWALKVIVLFFTCRERGRFVERRAHHFCKQIFPDREQIFPEHFPHELVTSPQRIVGSTVLLKYVNLPRLSRAVG